MTRFPGGRAQARQRTFNTAQIVEEHPSGVSPNVSFKAPAIGVFKSLPYPVELYLELLLHGNLLHYLPTRISTLLSRTTCFDYAAVLREAKG